MTERPCGLCLIFAIKNFIQESVQGTPFFLTYDRHPKVPIDIRLPEGNPTALNYVDNCNIDQAMQRATQCLQAAQQRQKRHANQQCDLSFKVKDQVLLSTEHIPLHAVGTKKPLMKLLGHSQWWDRVAVQAAQPNAGGGRRVAPAGCMSPVSSRLRAE